MSKNLRREKLVTLVGTTQHFVGKVVRPGNYEENGVRKMLISPLYILDSDGHYSYVEHTWMLLPEEYMNKLGYTIEFDADVYEYKKESGKKSCGLNFTSMTDIEVNDNYKGLRMDTLEWHSDDRKERRFVNGNLSIITAFENGEDLHRKKNGQSDMKNFVQKMKRFKACGKHGYAWSY